MGSCLPDSPLLLLGLNQILSDKCKQQPDFHTGKDIYSTLIAICILTVTRAFVQYQIVPSLCKNNYLLRASSPVKELNSNKKKSQLKTLVLCV